MSAEERPDCFGKIDRVFPMTDSGFRETPIPCMDTCKHRVDCLRKALSSDPEADRLKNDQVDRAYDAGLMGFFERWSKKKSLNKKDKKPSNKRT